MYQNFKTTVFIHQIVSYSIFKMVYVFILPVCQIAFNLREYWLCEHGRLGNFWPICYFVYKGKTTIKILSTFRCFK